MEADAEVQVLIPGDLLSHRIGRFRATLRGLNEHVEVLDIPAEVEVPEGTAGQDCRATCKRLQTVEEQDPLRGLVEDLGDDTVDQMKALRFCQPLVAWR